MRKFLSEDGVSMLFVLSALIVTGFIGGSLIKISGSDQVGQAFYKGSAAARSAAKSGMIAALAEIQTSDPTKRGEMIARLQKWIDTPNNASLAPADRWIVGGPNSGDFEPLSDNLSYRAELLAFDTSNFTVTLRADGRKTGGGSATYLGTYRLDGLEFDKQEANVPTNALHMGGGGDEFNRAMHIHGGCYLGGVGQFLDNLAQQFEFHGPFYFKNTTSDYFELKSATFFDKAYFDGLFNIQLHDLDTIANNGNEGNPCQFLNGLGIETHLQVWSGAEFNVEGTGVYANGSIGMATATSTITLPDSCEVKVNSNQPYSINNNSSGNEIYDLNRLFTIDPNNISTHSVVNVKQELKISEPPKDNVDMSEVKKKAQTFGWWGSVDINPSNSGPYTIGGGYLNDLYENYDSDDFFVDSLGEEWMVLELKTTPSFTETGEKFKYKIIWIINDEFSFSAGTSGLYNHENTGTEKGNTLFYVGTNGRMYNVVIPPTFRGFIFSEAKKGNRNIFQGNNGRAIYGGIYQQNGLGPFRIIGDPAGTAGIFEIHYDSTVINELKPLGIFVPENATTATTLQLQTNRTNIAANHLSAIM